MSTKDESESPQISEENTASPQATNSTYQRRIESLHQEHNNGIKNYLITLDPAEYKCWSTEEICALLVSSKCLVLEDVQPLLQAKFRGGSIDNIIIDIKQKAGNLEAIYEIEHRSFPSVPIDTLKSVVNWINFNLIPNLYHKWSVAQVKELLCSNGGLSEQEYLPLCEISGQDLVKIVPYVIDCQHVYIREKKIELSPKACKRIISTQFHTFPIENLLFQYDIAGQENRLLRLKKLGIVCYDKKMLGCVHDLLILLEKLEIAIQEYEKRKTSSISVFNEQMDKLGLSKSDSYIYLYPKLDFEDEDEETSFSCEHVVCSFAPTFPYNKYEDRETYLKRRNVLTFTEPPGTGKTHSAFHLTSCGRMVIPVSPKHISRLFQQLSFCGDSRFDLDRITQKFTEFYHRLGCFLIKYAELTVWILDEVQCIDYECGLKVPRRDAESGDGSLLTLLVSWLRLKGAVVLTTTNFSAVKGKIERLISSDTGKEVLEKCSYEFKLLPLLNPKQVIEFLRYFITVDSRRLWVYVSFFLQGTIRNVESFLQKLYFKASEEKAAGLGDDFILSVLHSFCRDKVSLKLSRKEEMGSTFPNFEYIFYKLAIAGEVNLQELNLTEEQCELTKFLICNGVSFIYMQESYTYKLSSCLEKGRMLNYVFDKFTKKNWVAEIFTILVNNKNSTSQDISLLAEVFLVDILINHFGSLIAPLVKGSYVDSYELLAKHYFEDPQSSTIDKDNVKMSSLMIEYLAVQTKSKYDTICQFLSRTGQFAEIDILGILSTKDSKNCLPSAIPLTVAISRSNDNQSKKLKKDFASSMYRNNSTKRKSVRMLFHPNCSYSKSLNDRITEGTFNNETEKVTIKQVLTDYSVITGDDQCVIEISSGIEKQWPEWKPFMDSWRKLFVENQ
ncbi:predicted protein [Naegleria gruberi]|uniref:Predicted protein n=1 Tax=Naegleria gruberi TaxID=5762 RepID=D2VBB4_NAEGR|nr:uncharacterized protein NAEGRDRAFT_66156 [Naegleria gruberi]EFC45768.1 predicted protein [Naegleria gruberi]|eukprot:XP_002678512.1 predicted protein [Naegleria gruberi strain NEG-M]